MSEIIMPEDLPKPTSPEFIHEFDVEEMQYQLTEEDKNILKIPFTMSETRKSINKLKSANRTTWLNCIPGQVSF